MNSTMDVLNHQYVLTYIFVLLFIAAKWHRDIYKTVYLWNNQQQLEEHSNNEKEKKIQQQNNPKVNLIAQHDVNRHYVRKMLFIFIQ